MWDITPMNPISPNEFILLSFDPGGAATGWAIFSVHCKAFSHPREKVLRHLKWWNCGQYSGTETEILLGCRGRIKEAAQLLRHSGRRLPPGAGMLNIITEDFNLNQKIGSAENLLSPVRINAVLDWTCWEWGIKLKYQQPNARMAITRERLDLYGFEGRFRKDEYAAMQHGITWLKKIKRESITVPWPIQ